MVIYLMDMTRFECEEIEITSDGNILAYSEKEGYHKFMREDIIRIRPIRKRR